MFFTNLLNDFERISQLFDYSGGYPPVQLAKGENQLLMRVELPGFTREGVYLSVTEDTVTISGKKAVAEGPENESKKLISERWAGDFSRTIELPCEIDRENVKADLEDGVLSISMPVHEKEKAKQIEVGVNIGGK